MSQQAVAITLTAAARAIQASPFLLTDRLRYRDDDPVVQIVGASGIALTASWSLVLERIDPPAPDITLGTQAALGALPPEFEILVDAADIDVAAGSDAGRYRLRIDGAGVALISNPFWRVPGSRHEGRKIPPRGIPLILEAALATVPWPVTTAVPLPLGAVSDPATLGVFDSSGKRVPAQVSAIAEWHRPNGSRRSVKWVALDFIGQFVRNKAQRYTVRAAGPSPARPAWVVDAADAISVDTGPIRFRVRKQGFNGIDLLKRRAGRQWRTVAAGGIGPYIDVRGANDPMRTALNRIRFTAADDLTATVSVIKSGDACVTIRAEGDYFHAGTGSRWATGVEIVSDDDRRHCHFIIDISAYRDCSQINVSSTVVITYDPGNVRADVSEALPDDFFQTPEERAARLGKPYTPHLGHWWKQPIDIGWDWGLAQELKHGYLGYRASGRSAVWSADPWTNARVSIHQLQPDRCSIVAEAADGLRYDMRRIAAGDQSEGWATADLDKDAVTVALRDPWQRFPKEMAIRRNERGTPGIVVHTWPRHGYGQPDRFHGNENTTDRRGSNLVVVPGAPDESLLRTNLWRLPFAHEGDAMDLRAPVDFIRRLIELNRDGPDAGWDGDTEVANALGRTAQGLGTTSEMALLVHDGSRHRAPGAVQDEAREFAGFWQSGTHALCDPQWNGDTRAEGRFDAPKQAHTALEAGVERTIDGWRHGLGGVQGCHGMWIHGSLHNHWRAATIVDRAGVDAPTGIPDLHRLWQASHYRNVWMSWLLYLRSGTRAAREWAMATSRLFADVGTIHRTTTRPATSRFAGEMAHVYAITPWGTPFERFGHCVDPDAHRLRFILLGDLYAQRLYQLWWQTLSSSAILGAGLGRETTNTLGALADYFAFTQDPSALVLLRVLGQASLATLRTPGATSAPFYNLAVNPTDHAVWNRRWLEQYFDVTGDIEVVRFAADFVERWNATPSVAAFAYLELRRAGPTSSTGVALASYLDRHVGRIWDTAVRVLDNSGGKYHGFGDHTTAAESYWLQEWPYFSHALRQAAISTPSPDARRLELPGSVLTSASAPGDLRISYPVRASGPVATQPVDAIADWAASLITVYVISDRDFEVNLLMQGGTNIQRVAGFLSVYRFEPGAGAGQWVGVLPTSTSPAAVQLCRLDFDSIRAQVVPVSHTGPSALYQILVAPTNPVPLKAPFTSLPEVLELRGPGVGAWPSPRPQTWDDRIAMWLQGQTVWAYGRQDWYVASSPESSEPLTLVARAHPGAASCSVKLETAAGVAIRPQQVAPAGPPLGPYEYNGRLGPPAQAGDSLDYHGGFVQLAACSDDASGREVAFVIKGRRGAGKPIASARLLSIGTYGPLLSVEGGTTRAFLALDRRHLDQVGRFVEDNKVQLLRA